MPWERKIVDEKRKEFVARAVMGEESISALCREYGISRPTGYKWIERYRNGESMCNRPHTPYSKPFKTSRKMELRIINEQWAPTKASLVRIFREFGLPNAILCDNGSPWADNQGGYTPFEIWMMQMDILPMHGRPLHPQTQGKDERFHRTLKEDLLRRKPLADLDEAQREFDAFRYCYNYERPHGALKLDVPAKHYKPSKRSYIEEPKEPEYDSGRNLRKVNCKGYVAVQKRRYYLSESMIGKYVELRQPTDAIVILAYGNFEVARIDLETKKFDSRKIYRL